MNNNRLDHFFSIEKIGSGLYRYGFNGKENDNEVKGEGNQQDYGFRIYDPRVGRFLSVDPITADYPELTPYQFASNRPIEGVDMDGLEFVSKAAEDAYFHRKPVLSSLQPAPQTVHATAVPIPPTYSDNTNQQPKPNPAKLPRKQPEVHVIQPNIYGKNIIGPKSVVEENVAIAKQNYYSAVGANIAGGPFGSLGYQLRGDQGSFVYGAVDQVMFSFGGVPREGFLSKPEFSVKSESFSSGPLRQQQGANYENFLQGKLGGTGSFKEKGGGTSREFDGSYGVNNKNWYEAKSGDYFGENFNFSSFKSDIGRGLSVAKSHGANYEIIAEKSIPQNAKDFLTKKGVGFQENVSANK